MMAHVAGLDVEYPFHRNERISLVDLLHLCCIGC
jgi:hypothetical protein